MEGVDLADQMKVTKYNWIKETNSDFISLLFLILLFSTPEFYIINQTELVAYYPWAFILVYYDHLLENSTAETEEYQYQYHPNCPEVHD